MSYRDLYEQRTLLEFFRRSTREETKYRWIEAASDSSQWEGAADWIAVHIANLRCGGSPHLFDAWIGRLEGGPEHPEGLRDWLLPHIASENIGTSENPAEATHLQGFVAEHIWHALISELEAAHGCPLRVEEPSWSVTDSGGDGLAVYRMHDGKLAFRLWEAKQHSGQVEVRQTVNRACRQLRENAMRYLARHSKIGQTLVDPELAAFYGRLVELWHQSDRSAGGGVSVCISASADAGACFGRLAEYWGLSSADQHEGLLAVVDDFSAFSGRVQETLWNGL